MFHVKKLRTTEKTCLGEQLLNCSRVSMEHKSLLYQLPFCLPKVELHMYLVKNALTRDLRKTHSSKDGIYINNVYHLLGALQSLMWLIPQISYQYGSLAFSLSLTLPPSIKNNVFVVK